MNDNYILKFGGYVNEANENDIPFFISDNLVKILVKIISEPLAKKLLDSEGKTLSNVSFLDVDKDSKNVSFMPADRLSRVVEDPKNLKRFDANNPVWTSSLRQSTGWGKLINRLFPGEFTNMDIDRFYNRYRPEVDIKDKEAERFKVVHGDDIKYWYHFSRYNGELGSCMRYDKCQEYFGIYTNNPEKCGLLIYFDDAKPDMILGRALVWNNLMKPSGDTQEDKNPYTLLDRVYYVNHRSDIQAVFHKYANDHGWIYKNGDSFLLNGQRKTTSVATRLKPTDYKYYPYADTMMYYTPATGRAASTPGNPGRDPNDPSKVFPRYNLRGQDGSKSVIDR